MNRTLAAVLAAAVSTVGVLPAATARPADPPTPVVTTDNETPVLYDDGAGGNASRSIVIVTAKEGGLRVYDLESNELQSLPATPAPRADGVDGRYNNVDI